PSAVRTYVDAFITIGPNGANLVGDQHMFKVTVDENTGNGLGYVPAVGAPVTVTLTNMNGAVANPPGPFTLTTDSSGHALVTFTSATAGQVIGNATTTLVVNGVTLTRSTGDGISQDSPNADKFFGALATDPGPTVALHSNTPLNDSATLEGTNPTGT